MKPLQGVRQGMPLSPLFANFYLCDFDDLIKKAGLNCIRYADDLIFFSDSEKNANTFTLSAKLTYILLGSRYPNRATRQARRRSFRRIIK